MAESSFCEKMRKAFEKKLCSPRLFLYETIGSTNTEAKLYAVGTEDKEAAFFIAKSQSAGRGRLGRTFVSDAGGLYLSYLFYPDKSMSDVLKLTVFAAVCLCEVIEEMTDGKPLIKWVNDVLLGGRKIAGILTEGAFSSDGTHLEYAVVGIGVNIGKTNFDSELSLIATDIESECGALLDIYEFAASLARKLSRFSHSDSVEYMKKYRRRSAVIGKRVKIITAGAEYYADALSIDNDGALIAVDENGTEIRLISGEVSIKM